MRSHILGPFEIELCTPKITYNWHVASQVIEIIISFLSTLRFVIGNNVYFVDLFLKSFLIFYLRNKISINEEKYAVMTTTSGLEPVMCPGFRQKFIERFLHKLPKEFLPFSFGIS